MSLQDEQERSKALSTPGVDYALDEIFELRGLLYSSWLPSFRNVPLCGEALRSFCDLTTGLLPPRCRQDAIERTVSALAGQVMGEEELYYLAWRIAGNLAKLRDGAEIKPWRYQQVREWSPAQVVEARFKSQDGKAGANFTWQVLAGTPSGMRVTKWASLSQYRRWAMHLGFAPFPSRDPGKSLTRMFHHYSELVSIRAQLLLEPSASALRFVYLRPRPSLLAHNQEIIRRRDRRSKAYDCPFEKPRSQLCFRCPIGYDQCVAGTHPTTYEVRDCSRCGRSGQLFEPGGPCCVLCRDAARV